MEFSEGKCYLEYSSISETCFAVCNGNGKHFPCLFIVEYSNYSYRECYDSNVLKFFTNCPDCKNEIPINSFPKFNKLIFNELSKRYDELEKRYCSRTIYEQQDIINDMMKLIDKNDKKMIEEHNKNVERWFDKEAENSEYFDYYIFNKN